MLSSKATNPRPSFDGRRRFVTAHRQPVVLKRTVCASMPESSRRAVVLGMPFITLGIVSSAPSSLAEEPRLLDTRTPMTALKDKDYGKGRLKYEDFVSTNSGLQYKDFREGSGEEAKEGDSLVIDWDGYTIGYYGRPFEARNKPKGSSFTGDNKDFLRVTLGKGAMIPAFEEALKGMKPGGIRRLIVPEELGYPDDWRSKIPKPSTFAGERALGFVLENKGMIDKTLLFDVELIKIVK